MAVSCKKNANIDEGLPVVLTPITKSGIYSGMEPCKIPEEPPTSG